MSENRISLLPKTVGESAVKIALNNREDETARAILFVPAGSCIYEHSHAEKDNPDSELYIHLENGKEAAMDSSIYVAGSNSPTGETKHEVPKNDRFQIVLAIKKDQTPDAWDEFSKNPKAYLKNIGVTIDQRDGKTIIKSKGSKDLEETVTIDPALASIRYSSSIEQKYANLTSLTKLQQKQEEGLHSLR